MLPSVERDYKEKIKQAEYKATEMWNCAIRACIAVVNSDKILTEEDKQRIIENFYK